MSDPFAVSTWFASFVRVFQRNNRYTEGELQKHHAAITGSQIAQHKKGWRERDEGFQ